ncbi:MAG: PAS domain S-box protein [Pirellulales bacterium]
MITFEEITKRKKAEEKLKESECRFRRYFELGLIGMASTSLDKRWIEFDDTLCNMFGYSREDFSKMTWTELTHPEDLDSDLEQFNRVLARKFHPFLLRRPKSFRGCAMFRSAILNVYKTRLRSRTSHALPRKDLSHLATKRVEFAG